MFNPLENPLIFLHDTNGNHINILKTFHQNNGVLATEFYLPISFNGKKLSLIFTTTW